jgi:hypothetical protein
MLSILVRAALPFDGPLLPPSLVLPLHSGLATSVTRWCSRRAGCVGIERGRRVGHHPCSSRRLLHVDRRRRQR